MNQYFFKLTQEERNNILDKHKHQYDGYATKNLSSNEQPIFVQDFANDKNGLTVNNVGNVSEYKNVGINEDFYSVAKNEKEKKSNDDELQEDMENEEFYEDSSNEEEEENFEQYEKVHYVNENKVVEIFSNIENESKFSEDHNDIKDSILESLSWFDRLNKKI